MELKLRWYVRSVKKQNGKEVKVYYISIPAKVAVFLEKFEPYLDLEKNTITFRGGEKGE